MAICAAERMVMVMVLAAMETEWPYRLARVDVTSKCALKKLVEGEGHYYDFPKGINFALVR